MRGRRRERARIKAEAEAQAALAAAHANAGLRAQLDEQTAAVELASNGHAGNGQANGAPTTWSPPGLPALQLEVNTPPPSASPDVHAEFLRVLDVVTRMCDHMIEYIEVDRAERRLLVETLGELARAIGTTNSAPAAAVPTRERVIGGSMDAGPEPVIDLREPERAPEAEPQPQTRVEVRCSFGEGERWVDGFEIIGVTVGENGPQYRLRRQRDGAILPQLFDAASIRHVETFEELASDRPTTWSKL